jgi:hypothetical protein
MGGHKEEEDELTAAIMASLESAKIEDEKRNKK